MILPNEIFTSATFYTCSSQGRNQEGVLGVKTPLKIICNFFSQPTLSICSAKHCPVAVAQHWCMFKLSIQCQFMLDQACTKTHHFEIKNAKIFWGGGHPLPRPHSLGAYGASIFAPTAQAQRDTPEKNPSYGLGSSEHSSSLQGPTYHLINEVRFSSAANTPTKRPPKSISTTTYTRMNDEYRVLLIINFIIQRQLPDEVRMTLFS